MRKNRIIMQHEVVIVICIPGCNGTGDLCLPMIREIVEARKVAFMIYSEHILEKVEAMDYQIQVKKQGDIPIGLYIFDDIPKPPDEIRIWRDPDGRAQANVPHASVYHSPDGFEFGYGGSGPADLALNILLRFTPFYSVAWQHHQDFKWQFIATMPEQGGTIPAATIRAWLEARTKSDDSPLK